MEQYCIYLRKSRADLEAEYRGEGETLTRHRNQLLALAKKLGLNISEIYSEIVSGERIIDRPVVQQLLREVEEGMWTGVLVMEVERLARGDTIDQGIVAQAFKYSGTKIITPIKTYDPNNEFDEEYFEFGLFMSRREYKTINRRLQRGRVASVKEGNYVANVPPYGYQRIHLTDGTFSLEPDPEQAPIVKMIFDMYVNQGIGTALISRKLNEMNIPTSKNSKWIVATVRDIIRNPVYIGKVCWNRRGVKKKRLDGEIVQSRPIAPRSEWIIADGKHPSIIDIETWNKAQEIMDKRRHAPSPHGIITNPLAGLIRCEVCGRAMIRRPYSRNQPASLICSLHTCTNVSSPFEIVEKRLLEGLRQWLKGYKAEWEKHRPNEGRSEEVIRAKEQVLKAVEKELAELNKQKGNLHDLLERGIYSVDEYLERSQILAQRIQDAQKAVEAAQNELNMEIQRFKAKNNLIPQLEHVLDAYFRTDNPVEKNRLLKSVLEYATYRKEKRGHWTHPETIDNFELKLYPKLP